MYTVADFCELPLGAISLAGFVARTLLVFVLRTLLAVDLVNIFAAESFVRGLSLRSNMETSAGECFRRKPEVCLNVKRPANGRACVIDIQTSTEYRRLFLSPGPPKVLNSGRTGDLGLVDRP